MKHKLPEKHIFLSDFQIPFQDDISIGLVLKFILDFKPDVIHFVGDILDLTKQSKYDPDPYDRHNLKDEIQIARGILGQFMKNARKGNKKIAMFFYEGNHERRQLYRLSKTPDLAEVEEDDEYILSLPHLLKLKKLGVTWVPYYKTHVEKGNVRVEHGDVVRVKAGYSAHAMLDRRGSNGVSGHTHRLGLIFRTQGDHERFWVENGNLCKRSLGYAKEPDWTQGFSIGIFDHETGIMFPTVVPIFNHTFVYGGKVYR